MTATSNEDETSCDLRDYLRTLYGFRETVLPLGEPSSIPRIAHFVREEHDNTTFEGFVPNIEISPVPRLERRVLRRVGRHEALSKSSCFPSSPRTARSIQLCFWRRPKCCTRATPLWHEAPSKSPELVFDVKKDNKMTHVCFAKKSVHSENGVWIAKGLLYSVTGRRAPRSTPARTRSSRLG